MKLPGYGFLIPAALLLGLAPFVPEPHLSEKVRWLFTGHPFRPIDIFDLFLHGTFPLLLVVKAGGDFRRRSRSEEEGEGDTTGDSPRSRGERRREERARRKG